MRVGDDERPATEALHHGRQDPALADAEEHLAAAEQPEAAVEVGHDAGPSAPEIRSDRIFMAIVFPCAEHGAQRREEVPMDPAGFGGDGARPSTPARLADDVHHQLLGRLLSHRLQPGQRLTVDALARELRVSQTPIREALHRLEVGGVVVRTHLADPTGSLRSSRGASEELVEVRLLLELGSRHAARPSRWRTATSNGSPASRRP